MICPYCEWMTLEDRPNGYYCPYCKREIPIEELIIIDQEKDTEQGQSG